MLLSQDACFLITQFPHSHIETRLWTV